MDKRCSKCGVLQSLSSYRTGRNQCKNCEREYSKNYKKSHREDISVYNKEYNKKWREANKERKRKMDREYYKNNSEIIKNRVEEWREANPERHSETCREYRSRNRESLNQAKVEWARAHPESRRKSRRKWERNNPEKRRLYSQNYHNSKRGSKITEDDINNLYKVQNGLCFYCGSNLTTYEIDHIIPLSKNGEHKVYNIVLSCSLCNKRKNNKNPETFVNQVLEGEWSYRKDATPELIKEYETLKESAGV